MKYEVRDFEWVEGLQEDLEAYMTELYESVGTDKPMETMSGVQFCACNVCEGREIVAFLGPRIIKGYLDGKVGFAAADESEVVEYLSKDDGLRLED